MRAQVLAWDLLHLELKRTELKFYESEFKKYINSEGLLTNLLATFLVFSEG